METYTIRSGYQLEDQVEYSDYGAKLKRVTARVLRDSYEFKNIALMEGYLNDLYKVFLKRFAECICTSSVQNIELTKTEDLFDEILRVKRYLLGYDQLPPTIHTT